MSTHPTILPLPSGRDLRSDYERELGAVLEARRALVLQRFQYAECPCGGFTFDGVLLHSPKCEVLL